MPRDNDKTLIFSKGKTLALREQKYLLMDFFKSLSSLLAQP